MKKLILSAGLAICTSAFIACNNNPDNVGSSNPIDSTNLHGAAPATYGGENPESPDPPPYEGQYDTGMQPNTMSSQDSINKGLK